MEILNTPAVKQRTLKEAVSCAGIGLHSGKVIKVEVKPAMQGTGIIFHRTDITGANNFIKAGWENVIDNRMSIVLGNENNITVSNVEYLMAALLGCRVDNAIIELDGPEVPVMNDSAAPFVSMIEKAGTIDQSEYRKAIWIQHAIEVRDGDKYALIFPSYTTRITVEIDSTEPAIGFRKHSLTLPDFISDNLPESFMQFEGDEFTRNVILKIMGALALVGAPVIGHLYMRMPDSGLISLLITKLFQTHDAWSYRIDCLLPTMLKKATIVCE